MDDLAKLLHGGNHLDIYLNHNCNLRCEHCFVGDQLDSMVNMDWYTFTSIVDEANLQGTSKVTFLGGEPTTYPDIVKASEYALAKPNIEELRIVTNGTKPYYHLIEDMSNTNDLFTIFSIDGASADTHNEIRGDGVFSMLMQSVEKAKSSGSSLAGITSLSKNNYEDVEAIIRLCDGLDFEYLNIHKTSDTGFASADDLLSPGQWMEVRSEVINVSNTVDIPIKFDRKYAENSEYEEISDFQKECFVQSGRDGNIMIYPDGRVYRCSLFMGQEGFNDYVWENDQIQSSDNNGDTEKSICSGCQSGCPGVSELSSQTQDEQFTTLCMYRKELIRDGEVSVYK